MATFSTYRAVSVVGLAQIIANAASHYLPAVIAITASQELGISNDLFFAGFSLALAISGFAGPVSGRLIDKLGGRPVLMLSNVVFAIGFALLAVAPGPGLFFISYAVLGLAMAMGLFESAFSAIVGLVGKNSRNSITGVTLIAGFASVVGWTSSVYVNTQYGWREVCWFWALLHLFVALPLNALLPKVTPSISKASSNSDTSINTPAASTAKASANKTPKTAQAERFVGVLLALVFALSAFIGMGLMAHLPRLLQAMGVPLALAFSVGALVGPAQILGRIFDFAFMRKLHPLVPTRIAALAQPLASILFVALGAPMASAFVILHGLGNGILIISRGTLPLAIFGAHGYGQRQGWLMMPSKFAQAAAPFLFGLAFAHWGSGVLWLTCALGLSIFVVLCLIKKQET